ncbi:probable LRR receptor-like serine/threonine-protein kinase At2g16250 isoform X1 [Malania oleifera]|uniref:probable LRR receptor-like serine/threonine-protein kinase At2g16250 isoform X1 n=1 Tax=Malania oleifera TaxID=397392 RepID=UPI0025ADFFC1|nr:probable LRR receptor-like serine/threonine-protein kinase At2g16250 isoform X1 [Malania oleifera]XP_057975701.1 probable LRR receptor-like serine/threonine-protein kinase At2g16250 isoform X1 [Malania oleifera]
MLTLAGMVAEAVLLWLLLQSASAQHVRLSSKTEWSALLELRSSLGLRAKYWPRKVDPCSSWVGVDCRNGRVVGINVSGLRRTRAGSANPGFSVDALVNFNLLASFNSSGFALSGSIPDWFGNRLSALEVLDLRSSRVTGPIPPSLGNLSSLNSLYLSGNSLTGSIPPSLGQLSALSFLDLAGNLLTGSIPAALSSLRNLTHLNLSSNYLSGSIPPGLGTLSMLKFLYLSNNSLGASIPEELGKLSRLIELEIGENFLSGSLPAELRGLRRLEKMEIGNNFLEGPFPDDLFPSLTQLQFVALRENKFDGALPDALWMKPDLRFLDVSGNNFTGILPNLNSSVKTIDAVINLSDNMFYGGLVSSLGNFSTIYLSGNYFQGEVPSAWENNATVIKNCLRSVPEQRSLEECRLFYAERNLTFDNFGEPDRPPPESPQKSSKRWVFILVGVFGGLGFLMLLVLVLILLLRIHNGDNATQRGTANVRPDPEEDAMPPAKASIDLLGVGERFTYEQMLHSTGNFSDANLIKHGHSGDLFRGNLEDGIPVVIKRVDLHFFKKDSCMLELDLFSKVSHTRLVPLLGHCLEHETQKFLVYKYMPNRDLSNSLHRPTSLEDDGLQSLDWITRLKIAIGAAESLSYLHHECTPPLVHRDVQASSILLDDKFEVRLGSLSEVCIQEGESFPSMITKMLRMPPTSEQGPSDPSSGSCAYDVYCFGKVLLELITGNLGISSSDDMTMKEWLEHTLPYISIYEKELVVKIVDPSLIVDDDLLEEVWAMAIVARSCLNPKPSKRPLMRYILRALENPLKVVREENSNSARLRTASSRKSWSTAFFGSWRQNSLESSTVPFQTNREAAGGLKQLARGGSQSAGANEVSSSNKRLSNEIFPEPTEMTDAGGRQDAQQHTAP